MTDTTLELHDLSVSFRVQEQDSVAVQGVSLQVKAGEILALVGESGSGKSTTAMSIVRLLPHNATTTGRVTLDGVEVGELDHRGLRELRGGKVGVIFQEPMTALNPVLRIGTQIVESIRLHTTVTRDQARDRAVELLELVGIDRPHRRLRQYPHELSGGQRQRVVTAMAIACEPRLLIADEPTTALDVTVQAEILELLRDLRTRLSASIILITHDMGVVADIADRVVVLRDGEVVEQAPVEELFQAPQHPYTKQLLQAVPRLGQAPESAASAVRDGPPVVDVRNLVIEYPGGLGKQAFRAVDDVSLSIGIGEILGLVGESGSGKSTIGRAVVGLLRPTSGSVLLGDKDLARTGRRELRALQARIGTVFQDPASSLNPRYTIEDAIAEPLVLHCKDLSKADRKQHVQELLDQVKLPGSWRSRYPHELSGGQRQRVSIARALALRPDLLVADEPTSALDVSVQQTVLELLRELQSELRFSCLFISHDLAVVESLAGTVVVLRAGAVVESGPVREVLRTPEHDYTRRLIESAPVPDPVAQRERRLARQSTGS